MTHTHSWTVDRARNRFRCACGVWGHKPTILDGQQLTADDRVQPYVCKYRKRGERLCGADAVYVTGDRQASRCQEHIQ